jgi:hypothetical protein
VVGVPTGDILPYGDSEVELLEGSIDVSNGLPKLVGDGIEIRSDRCKLREGGSYPLREGDHFDSHI